MADHLKTKGLDPIITEFRELDPKEELRRLVIAISNFKAVIEA